MASLVPAMRGVVARHTAVRSFSSHWDTLVSLVPRAKRKEIASERLDIAKRANKADNVSALPEIDWAHYENILGKDVVGPMKAEYDATPVTELDSEIESSVNKAKSQMEKLKSEVATISDEAEALTNTADAQLAVLERTRTDEDTTLEEVLRRYPDIYNELMKNIEEENFDTNFPTLDLNAMRLAAIKNNYDGKLTEEVVNEIVAEMEAMDAPTEDGSLTYESASYEDFSDEAKADLASLHEEVGVELTPELIAEYDAIADPSKLTAEEAAETDEGSICAAIQANLNSLNADASPEKALALYDHLQSLRASGDLVANPAAVASLTASVGGIPIVRLTEQDFEGKSADDLSALAKDAEASGDLYRACMYLYEAQVLNGEIDPSASDDSYSGNTNTLVQMSENIQTLAETGKRPEYATLL